MPEVHPAPTEAVTLPAERVELNGLLRLPEKPIGVVLFAHGSGSSRFSPRNNAVAEALATAGLASLLMDLLSEAEDADDERRFDVGLLAQRLRHGVTWLHHDPRTRTLPLGLFGASTGAAAALDLAAEHGAEVRAVVSRGGRPDLAHSDPSRITVPTLLIVGGLDLEVLALNRSVYARLAGPKALVVVPGATHLFEEPGTLERVSSEAVRWFTRHLGER